MSQSITNPQQPQRRVSHCSFCFRTDHNISRCTHPHVEYVFLELMWFYNRYGARFVCNNLPNILRPKDAQAVLGYEPIKNIVERPRRFNQLVEDVGMPERIKKHYKKLSRKMESLHGVYGTDGHFPFSDRCFENMEVVEPVLNETLLLYETMEHTTVMDSTTIMTDYHNNFITNRGARFHYYGSILLGYPPSILYPRPTVPQPVARPPQPVAAVVPAESEEEPEWLESHHPPRNVTTRTHIRWEYNGDIQQVLETLDTFEFWASASRDFEKLFKAQNPEVEIALETAESNATIECPICMTVDIAKEESVDLGCCVYSFCSDCYSKQYLTKENRAHQCMMCRTPFSKVKVFSSSVVDKLKAPVPVVHIPFPSISSGPNSVVQIEDEEFGDLPTLVSVFP